MSARGRSSSPSAFDARLRRWLEGEGTTGTNAPAPHSQAPPQRRASESQLRPCARGLPPVPRRRRARGIRRGPAESAVRVRRLAPALRHCARRCVLASAHRDRAPLEVHGGPNMGRTGMVVRLITQYTAGAGPGPRVRPTATATLGAAGLRPASTLRTPFLLGQQVRQLTAQVKHEEAPFLPFLEPGGAAKKRALEAAQAEAAVVQRTLWHCPHQLTRRRSSVKQGARRRCKCRDL